MRHIRGYVEYIREFKKYSSGYSSSGRTREFDVLYDEPEDISVKSPSARILLKKKLSEEEFADKFDKSPETMGMEDLMKLSPKERRLIIAKSNLKFLQEQEKKGELRCEYCNEGPLRIYGFKEFFNKKDGATADHKDPISKGGNIFDYNNLAVCCYKCNNEKDDMGYENWINRPKKKRT